MDTKLLGKWGEAAAAAFLRKKGWKILDMGYRCPWGEIDVIAQRQNLIAFVEVKLRKNDRFAPAAENVTVSKRNRLRTSASIWMEENGNDRPARFDVIEIYAPDGVETKKPTIHWIEDAFQ